MIPKFRAWHKTWEEMGWIARIRYKKSGEIARLSFRRNIYDGNIYGGLVNLEEIELMQSTGLFDKNGKEIFEGDIITTNAYACILSFGEYTYFEDEHTQTTAIGFYLSFLNVEPATYAPFEKFYWDNCKVIGNIYENELDLIMYEAWKFNKEQEE